MKINQFEAASGFIVSALGMLIVAEAMSNAKWLGYILAVYWAFNAFRVLKWGFK